MRNWWRRRRGPNEGPSGDGSRARPPLREFVYLDDVSLRSLLASQKGELTEQVTDLLSQADEAELASTIGASAGVLKAEASSRYRTTASQESQTSRRAVVQSLFKELRELDWIEVVLRPQPDASGTSSLDNMIASRSAVPADEVRRGTLVEVEVELVADPIFRFSTIASELTELARDFPEMLDQPGAREGMATLVPGNRFLQRFLAGLVPLRARALSHAVVQVHGMEYVVQVPDAEALGLRTIPLTVVGVTEQGSYWRDVRRVLFSGSRFTMLCRVARDGLWDSWEPVKLADVLKEVLPTFPDLIADVGRTGLSLDLTQIPHPPIAAALSFFIDAVETLRPPGLTPGGIEIARKLAAGRASLLPETVTGQNEAFRLLIQGLSEHGCKLTGEEWLELMRSAREKAGLVLDQSHESAVPYDGADAGRTSSERLLDTEVIAIYW